MYTESNIIENLRMHRTEMTEVKTRKLTKIQNNPYYKGIALALG